MEIETYECQETVTEPIEACEDAIRIMELVGLDGQLELTKKNENGNQERIPYREMTSEEDNVFTVLCPKAHKPSEYRASPMPLRVLQVFEHANNLDFFDRFEIWDRESASVKDPILVGFKKDKENTWREYKYILARWGEELDTYSIMMTKAIALKRRHVADALKSIKFKCSARLAGLGNESGQEILNNSIPSHYI